MSEPEPIYTELRNDANTGAYYLDWYCAQPPEGTPYQIAREEDGGWRLGHPVRKILAVQVPWAGGAIGGTGRGSGGGGGAGGGVPGWDTMTIGGGGGGSGRSDPGLVGDALAELARINDILRKHGLDYPLGSRGVEDLANGYTMQRGELHRLDPEHWPPARDVL